MKRRSVEQHENESEMMLDQQYKEKSYFLEDIQLIVNLLYNYVTGLALFGLDLKYTAVLPMLYDLIL